MVILYTSPGTAGLVVHWLLIELDLPYDLRKLDLQAAEHKQPAYLALNPAGTVPTLLVKGHPFAETAAILLWLGEQQGAGSLVPERSSAAYRDYLQQMIRMANALQPAFRRWFYPQEVAGEANAAASKAAVQAYIEAAWADYAARLQGQNYLLGEQPCIADFYLTMLMRWSRNMPKPATDWPALAAHAARMKARDSFKTLYAREGLSDWN